ncbi:MAG: type II toxin-antitoxin system Phd/YefM family antitoxin [Azonexus sp.]|jgi:prevent-host-death family protein|uniref:type II toxin-antitoxin system Phd/YefM family antitoxin n=1 Tax=Azonexus sp. TaxID=1872668 RepID=UPI00282458FE|nr:type II toxin-antitoxin system Phd/YefM family antitoxin [Azonexus sp.]MDR0777396.1 type II toxin-antitoxin system Phd/YefM family antitoxin [Azonexus sp.]
MQTLNIHEAKTQFSRLVEAVASGEEIVIAKAGVPAALLVPIERKKVARRFGGLKGRIRIADNFDEPLPDDVIAAWGGVKMNLSQFNS